MQGVANHELLKIKFSLVLTSSVSLIVCDPLRRVTIIRVLGGTLGDRGGGR